MNLTTFLELLDRHGPEDSAWPQNHRDAMLAFVRESSEAARQLEYSREIYAELHALEHAVAPGLKSRILAQATTEKPSAVDQFFNWLTAALWRPALLSVAPLALGTLLGMNLPVVDDASWNVAGLLLDEVYSHYE